MNRNCAKMFISTIVLQFLFLTLVQSSFIIRQENGLERLVIGIDEGLGLVDNNLINVNSNGTNPVHCSTILKNFQELLQRTSEFLFEATQGQSYFRQISILLPSNWATNCTNSKIATPIYETFSSADMRLTLDHPLYHDKVWTLQYGACAVPGKQISIPITFVGESKGNLELRGRLLLREWLKSRYGVFDENGFAHDERYPEKHVENGGSGGVHAVTNTCKLNRSCSSNSSDCDSENHAHSLMSIPLETKGIELCNEKTHIRTTPTKHNFLCDGKSIWEIMQQHSDFINILGADTLRTNSKLTHAPKIEFSYVRPSSQKMIFLLDRSRTMNQNNRWSNLRQTLYRVFHYIPTGIQIALISYTNTTAISLPISITTTHNRDHLHGRIPLKALKEHETACIACAVKDALKLMNSGESGPTTLILISSSPGRELKRELTKVNDLIQNKALKLVLIIYEEEFDNFTSLDLPFFATLYKIPQSEFHANLEQNEILNDVFLQIMTEALNSPLIKIYQTLKWPNSEWAAHGQFLMEETLGRSSWVTVSTEEIGDVDGLTLISPTGLEFDLPIHAEGLVSIKIPGIAEAGIWTYVINFYQNQVPRPVSIDVLTELRKTKTVTAQFWSHVTLPANSNSSETQIIRIYAQVLQGELPVLNANVTATIKLPGNLNQPKSISVKLLDTGSGDPDLTWGDGIYSAYFTQLGSTPGFVTFSGSVDDNKGQAVVPTHTNITRGHLGQVSCCGSTVPHISTTPTGAFVRKVAAPSFQIRGIEIGEDPYPPSRITDLRVEKINVSSSELKLSWTAPGGDFDKGKASRYEIRCYTSRDALTNENFENQGILVHNSLTPAPEDFGIRQSSTVGVPWANEVFFYGIVGIDSTLNRGKVSNLVSVFIKERPTSTVNVIDTWEDDALVWNLTSYRSISRHNEETLFEGGVTWWRGLNDLEVYIIIGGGATLVIVFSICVFVFVCLKKKRIKNPVDGPPPYKNIYLENGKLDQGNYLENQKLGIGESGKWESEVNSKESDLRPAYFPPNSSYIPASALSSPSVPPNYNNSIYRDIYGSTNERRPFSHSDSSSKSSESGSTVPCHLVSSGSIRFQNSGLKPMTPVTPMTLYRGPDDDEDGGFRSCLTSTPDCLNPRPSPCCADSYGTPSGDKRVSSSSSTNQSDYKRKTRHISFV